MKILTYKVMGYTHQYNPQTEKVEQVESLYAVVVECPTEEILEVNEQIAKVEAYKGEYTIEDDGQPEETNAIPTTEERFEALEAAISMLCMPDVSEG